MKIYVYYDETTMKIKGCASTDIWEEEKIPTPKILIDENTRQRICTNGYNYISEDGTISIKDFTTDEEKANALAQSELEQAEKDAEAEAKALIVARNAAEQAQFQAWKADLNENDFQEAMNGFPGGDRDAWLKKVWKERF